MTAEVATNRQVDPFDEERTWIRYAGPPQTLRSYSYSQVLARTGARPRPSADKIVVVGTEALRLKDVSTTSTTDGSLMSGPEVQGNAIATVLAGLPLRSPGGARRRGADRADGGAGAAGRRRFVRPLVAVMRGRARRRRLAVAAQVLFGAGLIIPVVHPLAAWAVGVIGVARAHARRAQDRAAHRPADAGPGARPSRCRRSPTRSAGSGSRSCSAAAAWASSIAREQPGLDRKRGGQGDRPGHAADARFRERFAREARLAAALDHPNIVPVYMTGDDHGQLYLVMRYVDGVNLAERLRGGPLPLADVAHDREPGRLGARRRPRARDRPSRRQAREHPARRARRQLAARVPDRLRDHARDRRHRGHDAGRRVPRQPRLRGARAGRRRRAARRPVLARVRRLRVPHRAGRRSAAGATSRSCGRTPTRRRRRRPRSSRSSRAEVDEAVLRALAKDPDRRWPDCTSFAQRLASALVEVG